MQVDFFLMLTIETRQTRQEHMSTELLLFCHLCCLLIYLGYK